MARNRGPVSLTFKPRTTADALTLSSASAGHSPSRVGETLHSDALPPHAPPHDPEPSRSRSETNPAPSDAAPPAVGAGAPTAVASYTLRVSGTVRERSSGAAAPGTSSSRTPSGADPDASCTHCGTPPINTTPAPGHAIGEGVRERELVAALTKSPAGAWGVCTSGAATSTSHTKSTRARAICESGGSNNASGGAKDGTRLRRY